MSIFYLAGGILFALIVGVTWSTAGTTLPNGRLPAWDTLTTARSNASSSAVSRRFSIAPDFTMTLFDGRELKLTSLRGSAVVLNFWASWCPPCRAEARTLERVWQRYKDRGVVFVGVDVQDTEKDARAFLGEFGITYPNGPDSSGIASSYGLTGIPETFFITKEGKLTRQWIGPLEERQLDAFIEESLR